MFTLGIVFLHLVIILFLFSAVRLAKAFSVYIEILALFSCLHIFAIACNIGTPIGLLYGPILYFGYQHGSDSLRSRTTFVLHFMPFLVFGSVYPFVFYSLQGALPWSQIAMLYYPVYFASMFVSLLYYTLSIIFTQKRPEKLNADEDLLITKLGVVNIANAVLIILLMLQMFRTEINYGFDLRLLVYGLLVCSLLLMLQYLYSNLGAKKGSADELPQELQSEKKRYQRSNLDDAVLSRYSARVYEVLKGSNLYLNRDLTPDMLCRKTGIPRHHFSQLFNVHIGKSFYQLIAEHRIAHAIEVLNEENNIKMESLAYECGFNSKTSFNRYFREQTGLTPSEYRDAARMSSASGLDTN